MQPEETTTVQGNPADMIDSTEHVLVVVRKHWIGVAEMYFFASLLLLALIILGIYVLPDLNLSSSASALVIFSSMGILTMFVLILIALIYVYHQSKLTLTDKSCVQVVQTSLFNRKTSRLSMSNVEDVNVEQKGIISSMFNFGTLTIQTAGQEDNFVFPFCPNPNVYAERILEARQAYARQHPGG